MGIFVNFLGIYIKFDKIGNEKEQKGKIYLKLNFPKLLDWIDSLYHKKFHCFTCKEKTAVVGGKMLKNESALRFLIHLIYSQKFPSCEYSREFNNSNRE